jgi:hypothetical protein
MKLNKFSSLDLDLDELQSNGTPFNQICQRSNVHTARLPQYIKSPTSLSSYNLALFSHKLSSLNLTTKQIVEKKIGRFRSVFIEIPSCFVVFKLFIFEADIYLVKHDMSMYFFLFFVYLGSV